MTGRRLSEGGRIDRSRPVRASFDGRPLPAFAGDTLAAALLAAGRRTVARSFKYHRPRGIYAAGAEEPNALVHLGSGARGEPNMRATTVEVFDGLVARSQNAWPSVRFDLQAANQLFSPFIGAGFYYKTFMGPFGGTGFWMLCERFIRRAAGMGRGAALPDPDCYEKVNAFCDVLVTGAGPAGLMAALAAGRSGARVWLVEQDFVLGGSLLAQPAGAPGDDWLAEVAAELEALPNVTVLTRATVFGAYDHGVFGIVEKLTDHLARPAVGQPRQRFWRLRAKQAVLATGAIEQPLVFAGNDRPGVMLAGAARTYVNRYAVLAGRRVLVATNNDSAYGAALDLAAAGAAVTLTDVRDRPPADLQARARAAAVDFRPGTGVLAARGRHGVTGAVVAPVSGDGRSAGRRATLPCDIIAVSGGWSPVLHLWSQRQQKPVYDPAAACFVPAAELPRDLHPAGAVTVAGSRRAAAAQGFERGAGAARAAGYGAAAGAPPALPDDPAGDDWRRDIRPARAICGPDGRPAGKAFVDLQHDVGLADVDLAHREGFVSVEHLKRYTTAGMATDQGKTSNLAVLSRMAELRGTGVSDVGTTTYRPPYTPVTIGAIAGRETGPHFQATRRTPMHDWHEASGAVMSDAGAWKRPWYYPEGAEDVNAAYKREAAHVRSHVGMVDVSTLGKIAVQGPDAAEFLNRVYVNGWKTLAVGRLRYGVMLREDGFVMDDGATARIGEHDYYMSTTTANAAKVLSFAEHLLQTAWCDMKVHVTSITDEWAAIAVAGPKARDLLRAVIEDADLSREALPNNHLTYGTLAGVPVRVHRMSYSGELAYEIYVGAGHGHRVWQALAAAGPAFDLIAYGTEAIGALRVEKGHVAGPEIEGRTTLKDLALEGFASSKKPFVGSVLRHRERLDDPARPSLVGLSFDGDRGTLPGALLFPPGAPPQGHGDGWVSSTTYSPALGRYIAMAFLRNGPARQGETVQVVYFVGGRELQATVVSHHFFDPEGERQNA